MNVLGLMSGTSLDGLDLAYVEFNDLNPAGYRFIATETVPYPDEWQKKLRDAFRISAAEITELDAEYGKFTAALVNDFLRNKHLPRPDIIASHGQTVFHRPDKGFTLQIGSGAHIMAGTGITTVCDFRKQDVALGGQGAPLVPIGDKMLFGDYDYCLNIGGFANISFDDNQGKRRAFDISPANIVLNHLIRPSGKKYDNEGMTARSGKFIPGLFEALNKLDFYRKNRPKSLGWENVTEDFLPLMKLYDEPVADKLHTFVHHIAYQIAQVASKKGKMLITGGGAYNRFLIDMVAHYAPHLEITIPDRQLTDFKEALVFALLGYLRIKGQINILASVSGACCDHSSGIVYWAYENPGAK